MFSLTVIDRVSFVNDKENFMVACVVKYKTVFLFTDFVII